MTEIEVKIESDWRVTIPKEFRKKSDFAIGDTVILKTKNKTTVEKISPEEFIKEVKKLHKKIIEAGQVEDRIDPLEVKKIWEKNI